MDGRALSERQAQRLFHLGLALAQAGDTDRLEDLHQTYAAPMAATPYASAFALFGQDMSGDVQDYKGIASQLAGVQQFEDFLDDYREKLRTGRLSAVN